jgi:hypothetical protein
MLTPAAAPVIPGAMPYDRDVHYRLTREWALQAGIDPAISDRIAGANQGMDDCLRSPNCPFNFPDGTRKHFVSRGDAIEAMERAIARQDPEAFGRALHAFQDSYSHAGFHWWSLGHVPWDIARHLWNNTFGLIPGAPRMANPDAYTPDADRDDAEMARRSQQWERRYKEAGESAGRR